MEIAFTKISPTQNVTLLVESTVPRPEQPAIAAKLLAYDSAGGEQAGFLEAPSIPGARLRLQMMGGEFCGNATMSAGAYLAWQDGLPDGASADYPLEVSGASGLTACRIERVGDAYRGTVRMPLPEQIGPVALDTDAGPQSLCAVKMPGITHVVADLPREEIERRIRAWNEVLRADALGVLRCCADGQTIEPIVYVPATESAVWERGCGSGTAALGCWHAWRVGRAFRGSIRQPGGEIEVSAEIADGKITRLSITGTVKITARGVAYL